MNNEDITHLTGMSFNKANNTRWTFNGINLPIGEALASNQITSRDLAWAAENAYDENVKNASLTVLLHRWSMQIGDLPKPSKLVRGSRYGEHKERIALVLAGLIGGALMAVIVVLFIASVVAIFRGQVDWILTLSVLILIPVSHFVTKYFEERADEALTYRHGRWGEEQIIDQFRNYLDHSWTIYHSFEWPSGKGGDIDLILVGPKGIWSLEAKAYSGDIRNIGDRWQKKSKRGRWANISRHPGKQARGNSVRLQQMLNSHGLAIKWVEPVVIWALSKDNLLDEPSTLTLEEPRTPVWQLDTFEGDIQQLLQGKHSLSDAEISQANAILTPLMEERRRENAK